MTITSKVIADSISEGGIRITTLELKYPRFIHSEFMTHRLFSRNASSNRATPVSKVIDDILKDPAMPTAMPTFWGKNQRGMQAKEECDSLIKDNREFCYEFKESMEKPELSLDYSFSKEGWWELAMEVAINYAKGFEKAGYHKQIVNRILEPFQHITVIVTATEWDNFFNLRLHPDAQPEIHELARVMKESMDGSEPNHVYMPENSHRGWHLPYILEKEFSLCECGEYGSFTDLIKYSGSRCARVSYENHDGSEPNSDKDLKLCSMLLESKHMSPFEHQASPINYPTNRSVGGYIGYYFEDGVTHMDNQSRYWSGNFRGWIQNRQLIEN